MPLEKVGTVPAIDGEHEITRRRYRPSTPSKSQFRIYDGDLLNHLFLGAARRQGLLSSSLHLGAFGVLNFASHAVLNDASGTRMVGDYFEYRGTDSAFCFLRCGFGSRRSELCRPDSKSREIT